MLTAEVMTCGVLKSNKKEQKPSRPKLGFEIMRTSSPLLKIIAIVPRRIIEIVKVRSRIRKSK